MVLSVTEHYTHSRLMGLRRLADFGPETGLFRKNLNNNHGFC